MKFLSARAGAAQSSSVFNCFAKRGTDQKDTEQILQHYKSRSVFSLHYFRKTFSTPFCIELTIASTCSTLLIKSKSSMSWLTEPFDSNLIGFYVLICKSYSAIKCCCCCCCWLCLLRSAAHNAIFTILLCSNSPEK